MRTAQSGNGVVIHGRDAQVKDRDYVYVAAPHGFRKW